MGMGGRQQVLVMDPIRFLAAFWLPVCLPMLENPIVLRKIADFLFLSINNEENPGGKIWVTLTPDHKEYPNGLTPLDELGKKIIDYELNPTLINDDFIKKVLLIKVQEELMSLRQVKDT